MRTLDDVRAEHNVVGAFPGVGAARTAILELERRGVEPRTISLLGAWPTERPEDRRKPVLVGRSAALGGVIGAVVGAAVGFATGLAVDGLPIGFAIAGGAFFFAIVGIPIGWVRATGMSGAWRETFAADSEGTVAVGIHVDESSAMAEAEAAMAATGPLAMNRF